MRYLLDTNIFIYAAIDRDLLSHDVKAILEDYDNTFYISSESVKEMIVGFNACYNQWSPIDIKRS